MTLRGHFIGGKLLNLAAALALVESAAGCLYYSREENPDLFRETEREVLMFRDPDDGGVVNLVMKSGLEGRVPKEVAWVIPLPSGPLEFGEASDDLFQDLGHAMTADLEGGGGGIPLPAEGARNSGSRPGTKVHPAEMVGNHEVIPIEIADGDGARKSLNSWLDRNGYVNMPEHIQEPYLKKGGFFSGHQGEDQWREHEHKAATGQVPSF